MKSPHDCHVALLMILKIEPPANWQFVGLVKMKWIEDTQHVWIPRTFARLLLTEWTCFYSVPPHAHPPIPSPKLFYPLWHYGKREAGRHRHRGKCSAISDKFRGFSSKQLRRDFLHTYNFTLTHATINIRLPPNFKPSNFSKIILELNL